MKFSAILVLAFVLFVVSVESKTFDDDEWMRRVSNAERKMMKKWKSKEQKKVQEKSISFEEYEQQLKAQNSAQAEADVLQNIASRMKPPGPIKRTFDATLSNAGPETTSHVGTKPHILVFLMDDLGYHDVGYADEPRKMSEIATPFLTKLAKEDGIILTRHYAHWHCSPSRRSFLSGRLPLHAGGDNLTHFLDDEMDLRFTWVSEKLKDAGYTNFFYGKNHLGTKSVKMLPTHRGFDYYAGFLEGSQSYRSNQRWVNQRPSKKRSFSTILWGNDMFRRIRNVLKSPEERVFLYYASQVPHSPLVRVPGRKYRKRHGALNNLDWNMQAFEMEMERLLNLFKEKESVWSNTLIVFMSDNGGTKRNNNGNNYPLRGQKGTTFEGGFRTTAFVSGGIIPPALRGTKNDKIVHIADWYRTFCNLAGVSGDDDPPVPPKHQGLTPQDVEDPQLPHVLLPNGEKENAYGDSYPSVDSQDFWPVLMNPTAYSKDALRPFLVLSNEVVVKGDWKLILAQPCAKGIKGTDAVCKRDADPGWDPQEDGGEYVKPNDVPCLEYFDLRQDYGTFIFKPCLFDLANDEREMYHLENPTKMQELWTDLNNTLLYQYNTLLWGKEKGVSPPECLGPCVSANEAVSFFKISKSTPAPRCGLEKLDELDYKFC